MKIKEQECQVGKIATIHRGVLTEKLVIFTHLFAAATHTAQAHMYIHTYYRVHTWSSPSHGRQHSVAAVRRRRQLLKRKGESKISECVCTVLLPLRFLCVCLSPCDILCFCSIFFCQTFIGIFYCRQYIIYGKIDCSVSCLKNQRLASSERFRVVM